MNYAQEINDLGHIIHNHNIHQGFWDVPGEVGTRIALVHSELSEALEADRKDLYDDHLPDRKGLEVELADAVIRILDMGAAYEMDLGGAIMEKLAYNQTRPYKHGKEY